MSRYKGQRGYDMGKGTHRVPMELFALNRERLCQRLRKNLTTPENSYIFLEGGQRKAFYNTDIEYGSFRQEPFFFWTFGIDLPDVIGLIEVTNCLAYIFIPRFPQANWIFLGKIESPQELKDRYEVHSADYIDTLESFLSKLGNITLLTLDGIDSDSGLRTAPLRTEHIYQYEVLSDVLYMQMVECRVKKTKHEIDVMRYVSKVTVEGHLAVMNCVQPDMMEYIGEAEFREHVYKYGGCRGVSYIPSLSSGKNTAILIYGLESVPNCKLIEDGDLCIADMGARYCGYAACVSTTFPANGVFSDDQRAIYEIIYTANKSILQILRPGQNWTIMHEVANRMLLCGLIQVGILVGDINDMMNIGIAMYFQDYGLGHMIGLSLHDVGGFLPGIATRPRKKSLNFLRSTRVLERGMVLTVQTGCYFINSYINDMLRNPETRKHINIDVLKRFRNFGGVKIGNVVVITKDGCEMITPGLPRSVEEIETFLAMNRPDLKKISEDQVPNTDITDIVMNNPLA